MDHSVKAYLERVSLEKLEKFLQDYLDGNLDADYSDVMGDVVREIALRKKKTEDTRQ